MYGYITLRCCEDLPGLLFTIEAQTQIQPRACGFGADSDCVISHSRPMETLMLVRCMKLLKQIYFCSMPGQA